MIIPVKCFTCGKVLADMYEYYQNESRKMKRDVNNVVGREHATHIDKVVYFTQKNMDKTPEGMVLDQLKIKKACCRRTMLTHVDIE